LRLKGVGKLETATDYKREPYGDYRSQLCGFAHQCGLAFIIGLGFYLKRFTKTQEDFFIVGQAGNVSAFNTL
jgi:hypothetical protein